jgi:hypothetical protein
LPCARGERIGLLRVGRAGRLNTTLLEAIEEEVFGHGIHSPRGEREVQSLDDPDAEQPSVADHSAAVIDSRALDDLIGRAGLTERERPFHDR